MSPHELATTLTSLADEAIEDASSTQDWWKAHDDPELDEQRCWRTCGPSWSKELARQWHDQAVEHDELVRRRRQCESSLRRSVDRLQAALRRAAAALRVDDFNELAHELAELTPRSVAERLSTDAEAMAQARTAVAVVELLGSDSEALGTIGAAVRDARSSLNAAASGLVATARVFTKMSAGAVAQVRHEREKTSESFAALRTRAEAEVTSLLNGSEQIHEAIQETRERTEQATAMRAAALAERARDVGGEVSSLESRVSKATSAAQKATVVRDAAIADLRYRLRQKQSSELPAAAAALSDLGLDLRMIWTVELGAMWDPWGESSYDSQ